MTAANDTTATARAGRCGMSALADTCATARAEAAESRRAQVRSQPTGWRSGDLVEDVIRFADWMDAHRHPPGQEQIAEYWGLSRSTAYRWLSAWMAARGLA